MGDQTEISEKLTFDQVTRNNNYFDLKLLVCKHHKMLDVIFVAKVWDDLQPVRRVSQAGESEGRPGQV